MKKYKILKIGLILLYIPQIVLGFGCHYYGFGGNKTLMTNVNTSNLREGIPQLITNIIDFILGCLVLPALIIVIIIGGIQIMISQVQGNPGMVDKGKEAILAGVIGLVIIYIAQDFISEWQGKLFPSQ